MKEWFQRIRGAIGMGLTWAAGWMPIGALIALGLWVVGLDPPGLAGFVWMYAKVFGILGLVGGGIFSVVLRLGDGGRSFEELSLPRFALFGAAGGLILGGLAITAGLWGPGLQPLDAVIAAVATLLGAGSAAGTLALARTAADTTLLDHGTGVEGIGPTKEEATQLLEDGG